MFYSRLNNNRKNRCDLNIFTKHVPPDPDHIVVEVGKVDHNKFSDCTYIFSPDETGLAKLFNLLDEMQDARVKADYEEIKKELTK